MPATRSSGTLLSFPQRKRTYHILLSSIIVISKDIILYEYQRQVKKERKLKDHRANKGEYKLASSDDGNPIKVKAR